MALTLISAGCLTLVFEAEGWFGRVFRIAVGLGLPWVVACLMPADPQEPGHRQRHGGYWFRLGLSYLGVIALGVVVILLWPYLLLFLMDSGLA